MSDRRDQLGSIKDPAYRYPSCGLRKHTLLCLGLPRLPKATHILVLCRRQHTRQIQEFSSVASTVASGQFQEEIGRIP